MNMSASTKSHTLPITGRSHVVGSTDQPLVDLTIGALLDSTVEQWPDSEAVVFREQGIRWTWREFQAEVNALAAGLDYYGIKAGDRAGIWAPNRAEWLLAQFATARLGIILVNINPAYRQFELEYALNMSGCCALISAERLKTSNYLDMLDALAPELATAEPGKLQAQRVPRLRLVVRMDAADDQGGGSAGMLRFSKLMEQGRSHLATLPMASLTAGLSCHDPVNIQFTSGTTGSPKGATLTHHNVVNNARFIAQSMRLTHQDILCIPVPLYHCFGMVLAVLASVSCGAKMVFPGEAFDPAATLASVAEEKCTALHGVPTMFIAELNHPRFAEYDLSSLRTGIMAGSPCPIETMRRVITQMHMDEITIAYGMTETSPVSFQSSTTDAIERRVSTVGTILPHLEAKAVDSTGAIVPVGQMGELCVRGYSVMQGYWGDEARTQEAIVDGWMFTGDLVTIDEHGYCNIVGRVKDMLIRGGENIYPREIEEFLFHHPKVESVQVFGVPDSKFGEEICAWIVLKEGTTSTEDEIRDFCKGQIAHYKVPRYIRFVDELPLTVSGKAQKFIMRQKMMAELNMPEQTQA